MSSVMMMQYIKVKRRMGHFCKIVAVLICVTSLAGCASLILGSNTAPSRFTISSTIDQNEKTAPMFTRLIIADPNAEAAFATSKIAHSPEALRFDYFTGGEWSDRAPRLFGIFIERSFENDGRITSVGDRVSIPVGDYILRTDIREFHIETRNAIRHARIAYSIKLIDRRNNILGSKIFSSSQICTDETLSAAVLAFNTAANISIREVIDWTTEVILKNETALQQSHEK